MKKILIGSLTLLGLFAEAQTVTWTSSRPEIVSVDANGTIKMESEPATTTDVTITQTTTQNEKTVTSTKIVIADPYCSNNTQPGSCCKFNNVNYCVIIKNGVVMLDRNLGASNTTDRGTNYVNSSPACPPGYRLPKYSESSISLSIINYGRDETFRSKNCISSYYYGLQVQGNYHWYCYSSCSSIYGGTTGACGYPARCIKS